MKKLNKKSKMFAFGLAITLFIALMQIFFLVNERMDQRTQGAPIGSNQVSLYKGVQEGEKSMLYGEVGFGIAFQQALYDIAKGGGTTGESGCGKVIFSNLWRESKAKACYPALGKVKEELTESTLQTLNDKYLSKNPYVKFAGSYKNNHEVSLEQRDDLLIARAHAFVPEFNPIVCRYGYDPSLIFEGEIAYFRYRKVVISPFAKERTNICGRYYYYPSYRKEIKFDINDFADASEAAEGFADEVQACIDSGTLARPCVFQKIPSYPRISLDCTDGVTEVFYSFADNYRRNIESPTSDCVFFYTPPQLIDVDREVEFRLKVISEGENTTIMVDEIAVGYLIDRHFIHEELSFDYEIDARGPYLAEYYNDSDNPYELEEEIQYAVTYDDEGRIENQEINYGEGGFFSSDWDLPGNIMFYKEEPGKVVFVDSDDYAEFNEVRFCMPQRENTFSFCYDTQNKAMAYDEESEEWAVHPLKIMFALSFPPEQPESPE